MTRITITLPESLAGILAREAERSGKSVSEMNLARGCPGPFKTARFEHSGWSAAQLLAAAAECRWWAILDHCRTMVEGVGTWSERDLPRLSRLWAL